MVECHVGQAWVLVRQPLGAPLPPCPPQKHHRHRKRRAQAHAAENAVAVKAKIKPVKKQDVAVQVCLPNQPPPVLHHEEYHPQQRPLHPHSPYLPVQDAFCPYREFHTAEQAGQNLPHLNCLQNLDMIKCTNYLCNCLNDAAHNKLSLLAQ